MRSRILLFAVDKLSRRQKRGVLLGLDALTLPAFFIVAMLLSSGAAALSAMTPLAMTVWLITTAVVMTSVCWKMGLYRSLVRYQSGELFYQSVEAVGIAALVLMTLNQLTVTTAVQQLLGSASMPANAFLIFWGAAVLWVQGSRLFVRDWLRQLASQEQDRVIIWGAGVAGCQLARLLQDAQELVPVAYVDDSAGLAGSEAHGLRVHHCAKLPGLVERLRVSQIIIALPQLDASRRLAILAQLEPLPVKVTFAPDVAELLRGNAPQAQQLREVQIDDLLDREPVRADEQLLARAVAGRSVMVTGAGGSIGSELCRQVAKRGPARIVLFERNEFALYSIEREMRQHHQNVEVIAVLGTVLDGEQLESNMLDYAVDLVYHAAAYKHVPLVESNALQGVQNNIEGTRQTALAAIRAGVENFVLVSTDKAVRPTNVMGASKRGAEQVLQTLAADQQALGTSQTCLSMVRFGNVLGSSGSVVPLFREQISNNGPVTVTHPDVIRYFMTIPEAAQLVMQAGAMATGGEVFLLDMGEPVNIAQMAERMIHLSGKTVRSADNPEGDIAIEYTGLRPGEKLFEELLIGQADSATEHPRIRCAQESHLSSNEVNLLVNRINGAVHRRNESELRLLLETLVPEYQPKSGRQSDAKKQAALNSAANKRSLQRPELHLVSG